MEDKTIGIFGVYVEHHGTKEDREGTEDQEYGTRQLCVQSIS